MTGAACEPTTLNPDWKKLMFFLEQAKKGAHADALLAGETAWDYWSSLVTSCCTLLACARAEMPVWLRISYFDMSELACA
jgi:hypothetical protein